MNKTLHAVYGHLFSFHPNTNVNQSILPDNKDDNDDDGGGGGNDCFMDKMMAKKINWNPWYLNTPKRILQGTSAVTNWCKAY